MRTFLKRFGGWGLVGSCLLLFSGQLKAAAAEAGSERGKELVQSSLLPSPGMSRGLQVAYNSHENPSLFLASETNNFERNLWLFMGFPCAITIIILLGLLSQEQDRSSGNGGGIANNYKAPGQEAPAPRAESGEIPRLASSGSVNLRMTLRGRDETGNVIEARFATTDFSREGGVLVLGRSRKQSHLVLAHDSISRQHISLTLQGESLVVRDLNSANGTSVNGKSLSDNPSGVSLWPGDRITIGEVHCTYERG